HRSPRPRVPPLPSRTASLRGGTARGTGGERKKLTRGRVRTAHCCAALPSEPHVPLIAAYGSSKPLGRLRFAVLCSCVGGQDARAGRRRVPVGFGHRPAANRVFRGERGSPRRSPCGRAAATTVPIARATRVAVRRAGDGPRRADSAHPAW